MEDLIIQLKEVLKELDITEYTNTLYTEYSECDYYCRLNSFILHESIIKNTSYQLLDVIQAIIKNEFDWDYKCEARFDVKLFGNALSIRFYKPVIKYVISNKTFDI